MNLLAFRVWDQIYYLDSCPAGLGGYSKQEFAWHFKVPDELLFAQQIICQNTLQQSFLTELT
jgi:hypothetical protein